MPLASPAPVVPHPLLDRLFDYAGLFPPAGLPLAAAAAAFAAHRARPEAWMLARFVVPLPSADALAALLPPDLPTTLAVLATPVAAGAAVSDALASVRSDLDRIAALVDAYPALAADTFELRPPDAVLASDAALAAVLAAIERDAPGLRVAVEVPWGMQAPGTFPRLLGVLCEAGAALKLRTGSLDAAAVPSGEALAAALAMAHRAGVPVKATAGLHHPLPSVRGGLPMHGFLNVFGGAALVHAGALDPDDLARVLADADPTAFALGPDGAFAWRDRRIDADAARGARDAAVLSIGSCSFDEPVDDLRAMGVALIGA